MKFLEKVKTNIQIFWHSLFRGMASADAVIKSQTNDEDTIRIIQQVNGGGVFSDMLQKKETQRVVEMRDKYYRVYREADNWDASNITIINEDENGVEFGNINSVRKKTKVDFMKHPPVCNPENLPLRTIQDNKQIQKQNNLISGYNVVFEPDLISKGLTDYETTLTIERDGITPRFFIEKYTKRMVVRENGDRAFVDLYLPSQASQFGKVDAILIANLHQMFDEQIKKSDIIDVLSFQWYSDKAWNSPDICLFRYDDIKFIGINLFDGSFVLTFDCNVVNNGTDLTEKYKTKELDKKYLEEAPKQEAVDIFTAMRRDKKKKAAENEIDVTNLTNTNLKIS